VRYLLLLICLFATAIEAHPLPQAPQDSAKPDSDETPADANRVQPDPDNKHIRVVRYTVPPNGEIHLPKLAHESLLICLRGTSLKQVTEDHADETCDAGGALWERGGTAYSVINSDESPAELMAIELKDSYESGQISAPSSERDPISLDPRHIHVVLENEHVRLSHIQLAPRQGTEESQFLMRLTIALRPLHAEVAVAQGKSTEITEAPGTATWHKNSTLFSLVNLDPKEMLDLLVLELKHPFCYGPLGIIFHAPEGTSPDMERYLKRVHETMAKNWYKHMPREAQAGRKGLVVVKFKIEGDGSLPADDIAVVKEFADETLLEKSLATVRQSGPFPPLPASLGKPEIELSYTFAYSMPLHPEGCEQ
jgi:hypothetical protein